MTASSSARKCSQRRTLSPGQASAWVRRLARHRLRSSVELLQAPAAGIPAARTFDAAIAVNCEQFWDPHRDSLEAIASALRPGDRLVTVTHQWAIEKRHSLPDWKALVQADLAGAGLGAPTWSEDRYRSGPAIAYLAQQPGQRKRRTCP